MVVIQCEMQLFEHWTKNKNHLIVWNSFSPFLKFINFFSARSSEYLFTNAGKASEWFLCTLAPSFIPKIYSKTSIWSSTDKTGHLPFFFGQNTCSIIWTETINGLVVHRLVLGFFFHIFQIQTRNTYNDDSNDHKYVCWCAMVCCWQREKINNITNLIDGGVGFCSEWLVVALPSVFELIDIIRR